MKIHFLIFSKLHTKDDNGDDDEGDVNFLDQKETKSIQNIFHRISKILQKLFTTLA